MPDCFCNLAAFQGESGSGIHAASVSAHHLFLHQTQRAVALQRRHSPSSCLLHPYHNTAPRTVSSRFRPENQCLTIKLGACHTNLYLSSPCPYNGRIKPSLFHRFYYRKGMFDPGNYPYRQHRFRYKIQKSGVKCPLLIFSAGL